MAESPDQPGRKSQRALLEQAAKEGRGKLKIFLGMAPGVGKTYAMLSAARAAKAEGVDVVVGLVETHGRAETATLVEGLEVLARKVVAYRGRALMEFDVDAAIARGPKLILVDEFAHTNAPGMLHAKRYQDVEELLRAGLDVWTTLNIQHLESLTDVVQRIAGITVRETVPDKLLEDADEIVVIDLPPEDLVQRLKEGKVYLPENARRAVDQFFKLGNLTALRELALRRAADRVDEQMLSQLRQEGIQGPWPTAERLLVCVGGDAQSETVVRAAARMASLLKSDWVAVHVRRSDRESTDRQWERAADKAMRLAERLGASGIRLSATDHVDEILAYARRNNITQVVVGRSVGRGLGRLRRRSLSDGLLREARDIAITVVVPAVDDEKTTWRWPSASEAGLAAVTPVLAVMGAIGIGYGLEAFASLPNLSMIFLLAVLLSAIHTGPWSGIIAAVLSFLAHNFFFISPRYSFSVAQPHELFSLLIFLVVAIVTGGLAGRLRRQAVATRQRAEATEALYDFSRKLSGAAKRDDVLWVLASNSAAIAKGKSVILMPRDGDLGIVGSWPPEDAISTSDWAAARWCFKEGELAGAATGTMPTARFQFRPLAASKGTIAVVGVESELAEGLSEAAAAALRSMLEQAAIALERTMLVEEAADARTTAEAERLRSALLSSLSHDLRTPLSVVLGAVTSLRTLGDRMPRADQADLLATIEEEAARLSRFVSNLLDMTRLEAGAMDVRRDWIDVAEVARTAAGRAVKSFPGLVIDVAMEKRLALVKGDASLLEQVVFGVLENAQKHSDGRARVRVAVTQERAELVIAVTDNGIGIPEDSLEKVFAKFYRVAGIDGRAPGTGLGLAIAAAAVRIMGGTIRAESPVANGRGTRIVIRLPVPTELPPTGEETEAVP